MKTIKNKTMATLLALILMSTIATTLVLLPPVKAYNPNVPTHIFIAAAPSPVGVGQSLLIYCWMDQMPPWRNLTLGSWSAAYDNFTVEITSPNGNKETRGPITTDPIGNVYIQYTPTQTGTYYFQAHFPGEDFPVGYDSGGGDVSGYYKASDSKKLAVTVQEEPIASTPDVPLPTSYWDRPIYGENRVWSEIGGNWLGLGTGTAQGYYNVNGNFNPYTTAPNTAHIVWTKPIEFGGIVGEPYNDTAYYEGISYEMRFTPPVIIGGRLYYNLPLGNAPTGGGVNCVDVRTGELIWHQNITISKGQLYNYYSPNQEGIHPTLWDLRSPTYLVYDAFSGELMTTFKNALAPNLVMDGPNGELLIYILDTTRNWMAMWNSSWAFPDLYLGSTGTNGWQWRATGKTVDFAKGIQWNVTIQNLNGISFVRPRAFNGHTQSPDIITITASLMQNVSEPLIMVWGMNAKTGQQLWQTNITTTIVRSSTSNFSPISDGIFTYFKQETKETFGYDANTGKLLWGPTTPYENDWSMYYQSYAGGGPSSPAAAYGKLYAVSYDGIVHCHDLKTGKLLWEYSTGNSGLETPYGTYPIYGSPTIADGKLYVPTSEHSINNPLYRGEKLHVINATTGEFLWSISACMTGSVVADGYLMGDNLYDQLIYCFGKGLTSTTVTTSPAINNAAQVLIQGSVTDQSPGKTSLGIPAAGTPAVSDASMSQWMEYLYQQQPKPTNATGVPVSIDAIDPNGNQVHLGDTQSDSSGQYSFLADQSMLTAGAGKYIVIATFKGSDSYFSSTSETAIAFNLPAATAAPTAVPITVSETYFLPAIAGLFVLIIIVLAAVILLIFKKRT